MKPAQLLENSSALGSPGRYLLLGLKAIDGSIEDRSYLGQIALADLAVKGKLASKIKLQIERELRQ
jgi:hypothetical protein